MTNAVGTCKSTWHVVAISLLLLNNSSPEKNPILSQVASVDQGWLYCLMEGVIAGRTAVFGVGDWNQASIDASAEKKNDITGREGKSRTQQSKWQISQFY